MPDTMAAPAAVRAAAAARGLTLRPVHADDPELCGAVGLLDRRWSQILYQDGLDDAAAAEVIAHEIGHFELHTGPEAGFYPRREAVGGDPNQRIETYGIKERREAQANSFAREFILPRPLAKRLFLEGARASGIAADMQVPYETVLQQLADGLLLPEPPTRPPELPRAPEALNAAQARAAAHRGPPYLLSAGPGTGKTKTLVSRIVGLLAEGVPASKILALTFSNKAALELAERVHFLAGAEAVNIWTGTFHAFGLDTIRKHHALFGVSTDPRVVDTSEAIALLEDALPALDIKHYLNLLEPALALRDVLRAIARAKDELCTPERYAELAAAMLKAAETPEAVVAAEKAAEVAIVYRHYDERLRALKAVDYGDLIMRPTLMMRDDADFATWMRSRFSHILVDEYQDINRASAMLVHALAGSGDALWVVGDARQSLYRFRGASAANIARFEQDYGSGQRDSLDVNYRSTAEIVEAYTSFGAGMRVAGYAGPATLTASRPRSGVAPAMFALEDADAEMDALAGSVRALEQQGVALAQQTVLARSNGTLARVAEELEARGVPVLYLGPLFERDEVRDLLSMLSLVADASGAGLLRLGALPDYSVPLADVRAVLEHARATEQRVFDLLRRLEEVAGLSAVGLEGLRRIAEHLHGATQGTTPWLLVSQYLFDGSDYVRTVLAGQAPSDDMRRVAVRQLIDCLRAMPLSGHGTPIRRALDRIRHMIMLADERDLRQLPAELDGLDGVRLMTVHASKGLEFEAVHLPCLYAGAMPAANRPVACPPPVGMIEAIEDDDAHEAEEECILFVAMSRARAHLRLYRPSIRGGRKANPSRFLERVPVVPATGVARVARTTPAPSFSNVTAPAAPADLTANDVERYVGCPRRFFYERVLNLGGRAREGAYLKANGCLQAVLRYVRALDDGDAYDPAHATALFDGAWRESGLADHPFGPAYRRLTLAMLDRLHVAASGGAQAVADIATMIAGEAIKAGADRIIAGEEGIVVRNLRSGRGSSSDPDRLSATVQLKAVVESFGSGARIEAHYLMSGATTVIAQTDAKYRKRLGDCEAAIGAIRAGQFPPAPGDFQCARCAYLFICPAPLKA